MKIILFLCATLPLDRLIWLGLQNDLGANPIEIITRSTGTWALVFLCLTLAMTPLRLISGSLFWIKQRRMLGLFCFFYATLHFFIWLYLDQDWDVHAMLHDVLKRPFITMGFLSYLLLLPLAISSNRFSQRRLGRRWLVLHRLVYLIAGTVILHYWWHKAGKNNVAVVEIYAVVLGLLLICRLPPFRVFFQSLSK